MARHSESRLQQPWFIRRIFYLLIGTVGAILFGLGIADAAQIEEWTTAADRLAAPALMVLTAVIAGPKANPGSDEGHPRPEVVVTKTPAVSIPSPQEVMGNTLLEQMRERIAQSRSVE